MLNKRARQAGLDKRITWHDFRRTFAGNLLETGHDLVTVPRVMGHATPVTTSLYDPRAEKSRRRAMRSLHVFYQPRRNSRGRGVLLGHNDRLSGWAVCRAATAASASTTVVDNGVSLLREKERGYR